MNRLPRRVRSKIYIQKKNHLRKYGRMRSYFKVSEEILKEDDDYVKDLMNYQVNSALEKTNKNFNVNYDYLVKDIQTGHDNLDFPRGLQTVLITYRRKKAYE